MKPLETCIGAEWQLEEFMRENNWIEREREKSNRFRGVLNPGDMEAMRHLSAMKIRETPMDDHALHILHLHLCKHLRANWAGRYRQGAYENVRVGRQLCPPPSALQSLMEEYWQQWPGFNAFHAYHAFEKIHPFIDRNGRIGRLLWLFKCLDEGYQFDQTFLETHHYQTFSTL